MLILFQVENMMKLDAEMTEDVVAYNIVPLDSPSDANKIAFFPEVKYMYSNILYWFSWDNFLICMTFFLVSGESCHVIFKILQRNSKTA